MLTYNENYSKTRIQKAYENILEEIKKNQNVDLTTLTENHLSQDIEKKVSRNLKALYGKESLSFQQRIYNEIFKYGPLEILFQNENINEIFVNSPSSIWFEENETTFKHDDTFFSPLSYRNCIQRICEQAGLVINLNTPSTNGKWKQFRLHIIEPPLVEKHPCLSFRRHKVTPWSFNQFKTIGWGSESAIKKLQDLVEQKCNFIIVGPTGSGKTSLLSACLQHLKSNERIIIIEDTDEIVPPNLLSVKLLTRKDPHNFLKPFNQSDLVYESLRMKPDRIVLGEVRGGEAKDLLLALATGHKGSLSTLHADHPHQALLRLEMLIQMGAPKWNHRAIRELIRLSLEYIVVVGIENKNRIFKGIYKISSLEDSGFLLEEIV